VETSGLEPPTFGMQIRGRIGKNRCFAFPFPQASHSVGILDLQQVISAWPRLPEVTRRSILRLVETAATEVH